MSDSLFFTQASRMYASAYEKLRNEAQSEGDNAQFQLCLARAGAVLQKSLQLPLDGNVEVSSIDFRLQLAVIMQDVPKLLVRGSLQTLFLVASRFYLMPV